jgi:hypothetical protein
MLIVTEYIKGETLREEIQRGPMPPPIALQTAIALAAALAAAHAGGVIHRDLKPENVMRPAAGGLKILDFGLAQMPEGEDAARLTVEGRVIGTPAYMAPEQILGNKCDERTDIFSFGIVIFELLAGKHPFGGDGTSSTTDKIVRSEPGFPVVSAREGDSRLVGGLWRIVRTCLAKRPEARFASAQALLAALELVRSGSSPSEPPRLGPALAAMRWWQFHQAAACVGLRGADVAAVVDAHADRTVGASGYLWPDSSPLSPLPCCASTCCSRPHRCPMSGAPSGHKAIPGSGWPKSPFVAVLAGAGFWVLESLPALGALLVSAGRRGATQLHPHRTRDDQGGIQKLSRFPGS